MDTVPCPSCSIPLYCSHLCQVQAGGQKMSNDATDFDIQDKFSSEIRKHIRDVTSPDVSGVLMEHAEHQHECQGVNWPAVLPSEVVLAGRILVKSMEQKGHLGELSSSIVNLELCDNYDENIFNNKLEMHVYSIILVACLQHSYSSRVIMNGVTVSQFHSLSGACQEGVAYSLPLELSYGPQVGQWDCKDRQQFLQDQYTFRCQCRGCSELNLSDLIINAFRCVKLHCYGVVLDSSVTKYENQKTNIFLEGPKTCSTESHMLEKDDFKRMAGLLLGKSVCRDNFQPGFCLNCSAYCNLEASKATVNKAEIYIRRLEKSLDSLEVPSHILADALKSLDALKSVLHPYNKRIAQVEDSLARAFYLIGEVQAAKDRCKASIQILEKLYDPNHIVVGNELVKLASMQLSLGDVAAVESSNKANLIFSRYYGSHADDVFPHLRFLSVKF